DEYELRGSPVLVDEQVTPALTLDLAGLAIRSVDVVSGQRLAHPGSAFRVRDARRTPLRVRRSDAAQNQQGRQQEGSQIVFHDRSPCLREPGDQASRTNSSVRLPRGAPHIGSLKE